jgi:hypothetical protein
MSVPAGAIPGCVCPLCQAISSMVPAPQVPAPQPTPGMAGFGEEGPEDFAAGTLTGYRWWTLPAPDFRRNPLTADEHWPRSLLSGQRANWQPGVNLAVCLAGPGAHEEKVPAKGCGCGIWFYKDLRKHSLGRPGELAVAGVVEGWGRSRTGSLGFRSAKAKILALCLEFEIQAYRGQPGWYDAFGSPPGQVDIPQADKDRIECWMAVVEDRLAQTYPGVRMYSVQKAMLARFPLRS